VLNVDRSTAAKNFVISSGETIFLKQWLRIKELIKKRAGR
jgi:hypothetical protein